MSAGGTVHRSRGPDIPSSLLYDTGGRLRHSVRPTRHHRREQTLDEVPELEERSGRATGPGQEDSQARYVDFVIYSYSVIHCSVTDAVVRTVRIHCSTA